MCVYIYIYIHMYTHTLVLLYADHRMTTASIVTEV